MKKPAKKTHQPHSYEEELSNDLNAWFVLFALMLMAVLAYLLSSKEVWSEILE